MKAILPALAAAVLSGCALMQLDQELQGLSASIAVIGGVRHESARQVPLVVVAYHEAGGRMAVADYQVLEQPGPYVFVLPRGTYEIAAFADLNRNGTYDSGEPAGKHGAPVRAGADANVVENVVVMVSASSAIPGAYPADLLRSGVDAKRYQPDLGAVADLDDPVFSSAYGEKGFWEPLTFLREVRGGAFFLQDYDPAKIPVLFIHGAAGSPQDWRYFFERLDRDRYQPWFYFYASALRLEDSAYWLNRTVEALHQKYRFGRLYVAAHSMGGIIAHRFIALNARNNPEPYVRLLVTFATPWGGVEAAQTGTSYSPVVIPSWIDLVPGSEFLSGVHGERLPPHVPHHLLFSYAGRSAYVGRNNDGVVTLSSQLDPRIQARAAEVQGFDADHLGILSSLPVFEKTREIFERARAAR